jgi:hypothetical protein
MFLKKIHAQNYVTVIIILFMVMDVNKLVRIISFHPIWKNFLIFYKCSIIFCTSRGTPMTHMWSLFNENNSIYIECMLWKVHDVLHTRCFLNIFQFSYQRAFNISNLFMAWTWSQDNNFTPSTHAVTFTSAVNISLMSSYMWISLLKVSFSMSYFNSRMRCILNYKEH